MVAVPEFLTINQGVRVTHRPACVPTEWYGTASLYATDGRTVNSED